jgi:putative membrane protein
MTEVARILHVLGVILWIGGGLMGALLAASAVARGKEVREAILGDLRRALLFVSAPGLVLAFVSAIAILASHWDVYRTMGWSHAKLTLGILLAGVSGVLSARVRKAAMGERESSAGLYMALGGTLAIGGLLALVLVFVRPF